MSEDPVAKSLTLLRERVAAVPSALAAVSALPIDVPELTENGSFVVTGVGASEGPARMLAHRLCRAHGRRAAFVPLSCFAQGGAPRLADTLVVFSQGLSPNARMALSRAGDYARSVLFTSATEARSEPLASRFLASLRAAGTVIAAVPPEGEGGTLVRIVGPAAASFAAARALLPLENETIRDAIGLVPSAAETAAQRAMSALGEIAKGHADALLARPLAFLTCGESHDAVRGLIGKWHEGLAVAEPPHWDVLGVAHGPFQQLYEREVTLIALVQSSEANGLFDRLERMLVPSRHALIRLVSKLPAHLAFFDFDAQMNALLLAAFERAPRDLSTWPGFGRDAPLYGIDGAHDRSF